MSRMSRTIESGGIRTRDPHLGKVFEFVHGVRTSPLSWAPVYGMSTESA